MDSYAQWRISLRFFYFEGKPYFWANAIQLLKIFNWKIGERVKIYSRGKIDVGS